MTKTRSSLLHRVRDPADTDGWREFFALYEPLIRAYVRKKGVAPHHEDDAIQDVLARLVKALPGFHLQRERGRFRTWLWRVTANTLADRARRDRRRIRAERDHLEDRAAEVEDGDWVVLHRRHLLEFAMEKVRDRSRPRTWACFEEHLRRGRPSAEVAAELGVAPNVVNVNASRVLARLKEFCRLELEGLFDGEDPLSA
jgi:RNA polymerase sigma-70 factor (ECF subfamily)